MTIEEKKEICMKKDFKTPRNPERIPVIGELILEYWEKTRTITPSVGFYTILNAIELEAFNIHKRGEGIDPFYIEDDEWFEIITNLINNIKYPEEIAIIPIEEKALMSDTVEAFCKYWNDRSDYRFKQVVNSFDELVETSIRTFKYTKEPFFGKIILDIRMKDCEANIHRLEDIIESLKKEKSIGGYTIDQLYIEQKIEKIKQLLNATKIKKESLIRELSKKEYD